MDFKKVRRDLLNQIQGSLDQLSVNMNILSLNLQSLANIGKQFENASLLWSSLRENINFQEVASATPSITMSSTENDYCCQINLLSMTFAMSNAQLMNPNWFTGLIADALQSVTEKNSVLLVYIYDDSDRSEQFDAAFASEKVSVVMGQKTVSLKFMKESSNAMLFAQIYPVSKVPVVYFIVQGTIKDFLTEAPSAADIIDKINAVYSSIPDKTEKATQSAKEGQKKIAKRRETSKPSIEKVEYCNLKIKQLDGSSIKNKFRASDKLLLVTEWIDQFRTDGDRPYKLFIQFPTKEFDIGDEQRTLYELKLCPNSTLLMKPIKNVSTAYAKHSGNTSQKGWLSYIYTAGNSMYQSVSQASESIVFYFAPTSHQIPEPPQRLGNGEPFTANQNLYNGYQPNLNTLQGITNDERDSRKKDHKVYNGNSINQE